MSVELLRIEFRIVGLQRDDDGAITDAPVLAEGTAYPAGLDDLAASVRKVIEEANQALGPDAGSPLAAPPASA